VRLGYDPENSQSTGTDAYASTDPPPGWAYKDQGWCFVELHVKFVAVWPRPNINSAASGAYAWTLCKLEARRGCRGSA
jgi:hypothetical protein